MYGMDAHRHPMRTRRATVLWAACATVVLVLAACTQGPATSSLTASQGGNPSLPGQGSFSQASESESESQAPSPSSSSSEGGTLAGTWDGSWQIDPPYAQSVGNFTMELTQTGDSFSGTVEITNTDCGDGTVSGTVSGASVTFGWVTTLQPVQFTGTLNGSSMSGTWSSVACSNASISLTGTWQATKK